MAEPEASSSHVVIDIGVCCAVCMEPAEWVAVGRCGHREVCVVCAARIRFFQNDSRCCICRAHCPSVVITRADSAASVSKRGYYGYHRGMKAYFLDRGQYEAMKKLCVRSVEEVNNDAPSANETPPPQPANLNVSLISQPSQSLNVDDDLDQPQNNKQCQWVQWLVYLLAILTTMEFFGAFYALADNTFQKVFAVLACVLVFVGFTFCFFTLQEPPNSTSEA